MTDFEKWQRRNGIVKTVLILVTFISACYIGFRQTEISAKQNKISAALVDLQYAVSVNISYDFDENLVSITNKGQGNIFFWGSKLGSTDRMMEAQPRILAQDANFTISPTGDLKRELIANLGANQKRIIPMELYAANQRGTKYVIRCLLVAEIKDRKPHVMTQTIGVQRSEWPLK